MSAYANFFIRWKDEFIPIADYSRNHEVYHIVENFAPWEKIKALSTRDLEKFMTEAETWRTDFEQRIKVYRDRIQTISTFNNSVDEKISALRDCEDAIEELESYVNEATIAYDFFAMLAYNMIPAVRYDRDFGIDYDHYIYVGIEIGRPTMEDIVNDAT